MITQELLVAARLLGRDAYKTLKEAIQYGDIFYSAQGEELTFLGMVKGINGGDVYIFNKHGDWHNNITESTFMRDLLLAEDYPSSGYYLTQKEVLIMGKNKLMKEAAQIQDLINKESL